MDYLFKLASLIFRRLWFGELSPEYFFSIQKFRSRHPSTRIAFKSCFKSDVSLRFEYLCRKKPGLPDYNTGEKILFDNHAGGLSYDQICRIKGKPFSAKYERMGTKLVKVICFRDTILEKSVKAGFFFLEERFFLGEYMFQSYNRETLESIRNGLQAKYHITTDKDGKNFYITDENGSVIFYNDSGHSLNVHYYFPQLQEIHKFLLDSLPGLTAKKERTPAGGKSLSDIL